MYSKLYLEPEESALQVIGIIHHGWLQLQAGPLSPSYLLSQPSTHWGSEKRGARTIQSLLVLRSMRRDCSAISGAFSAFNSFVSWTSSSATFPLAESRG